MYTHVKYMHTQVPCNQQVPFFSVTSPSQSSRPKEVEFYVSQLDADASEDGVWGWCWGNFGYVGHVGKTITRWLFNIAMV